MTLTIYKHLEQGSDEWLEARRGILTASVIGKLITEKSPDALTVGCSKCGALPDEPCINAARKIPTAIKTVHDERSSIASQLPNVLAVADNETSRGLILTLAAERITGHVEYLHPSLDMQRGTDDEPVARAVYAERYAPVEEVGFIRLDADGYTLGYSPDGMVGDDGLLEIKSRRASGQIIAFLSDKVPTANVAQLQCGLFITGRAWIDYMSYSAGLPPFVKRVYPDPDWQEAIIAAARAFEVNIAHTIRRYETRSYGLPATERRPDYYDLELKL